MLCYARTFRPLNDLGFSLGKLVGIQNFHAMQGLFRPLNDLGFSLGKPVQYIVAILCKDFLGSSMILDLVSQSCWDTKLLYSGSTF